MMMQTIIDSVYTVNTSSKRLMNFNVMYNVRDYKQHQNIEMRRYQIKINILVHI